MTVNDSPLCARPSFHWLFDYQNFFISTQTVQANELTVVFVLRFCYRFSENLFMTQTMGEEYRAQLQGQYARILIYGSTEWLGKQTDLLHLHK